MQNGLVGTQFLTIFLTCKKGIQGILGPSTTQSPQQARAFVDYSYNSVLGDGMGNVLNTTTERSIDGEEGRGEEGCDDTIREGTYMQSVCSTCETCNGYLAGFMSPVGKGVCAS